MVMLVAGGRDGAGYRESLLGKPEAESAGRGGTYRYHKRQLRKIHYSFGYLFGEVLEQFGQKPYNNETAVELNKHLDEPYSECRFNEYCRGAFLQKLNRHGNNYSEHSFYAYILKKYIVH